MDSPYATRARAARYIRGAFLFLRGYIRYDGVCVPRMRVFGIPRVCIGRFSLGLVRAASLLFSFSFWRYCLGISWLGMSIYILVLIGRNGLEAQGKQVAHRGLYLSFFFFSYVKIQLCLYTRGRRCCVTYSVTNFFTCIVSKVQSAALIVEFFIGA